MARRFRRVGGGVEARLAVGEAHLLAELIDDLLALMADDPLVSADPVLGRLFPDGYRDDPDAAAELRSLTQGDLQEGKRAALRALRAGLGERERSGRISLDGDAAELWLGALNDLRLALGTRLDVTEETYDDTGELADATVDDVTRQALEVYAWLGWLQESLVDALTSG